EYDFGHRVTKRTNAKGEQTRYSYDAYGRVTQVTHWAWRLDGSNAWVLYSADGYDYYYDGNSCERGYSQYGWGRLTAVGFSILAGQDMPCTYQYSYNQGGRMTKQKMSWSMGGDGESPRSPYSLEAAYEWDTEGRLTSTNPSLLGRNDTWSGTKLAYGY